MRPSLLIVPAFLILTIPLHGQESAADEAAAITDPQTGRSRLDSMGVLDKYNNVAIVKVVASEWVDFLQEAKFNGEWEVINVLWALKPDSDLARRLK